MCFTLLTEFLSVSIKTTKCAQNLILVCAELFPLSAQCNCIGCFFRAKAPIAPTSISWTDGSATRVRYRAEARRTLGDHDTGCSSQFTLDTDAVWGGIWFAPM